MKTAKPFVPAVALFIATTSLCLAAAVLPQRFRIPAGTHAIPAEGASITAICLDGPRRHAPIQGHIYSAGTEALTVDRISPEGRQTLPYNKAAKEWLFVEGEDSFTTLKFRPRTPDPRVSYELRVTEGGYGVVGSDDKDLNDICHELPKAPASLKQMDHITQTLETVFGKDSMLTETIRDEKYRIESKLHTWNDAEAEAHVVKALQNLKSGLVASQSKTRTIEFLTLEKNGLLTPSDIAQLSAADLIPATTQNHYDPDFLVGWGDYQKKVAVLAGAFGNNHSFVKDFKTQVLNFYNNGNSLVSASKKASETACKTARALSGKPGAREILSLLQGSPISDKQAAALKALGIDLGKPTSALRGFLYVSKISSGYTVRTTSAAESLTEDQLEFALRKHLSSHPYVVLDHELSKVVAPILYRIGTYFFTTSERLLRTGLEARKQIKLFCVISRDKRAAATMFEGQFPESVARAAELANDFPQDSRVIVESLQDLVSAQKSLKPNEKAIIIFHGGDTLYLKDRAIPVSAVADWAELISCDTFRSERQGAATSTGLLELERAYRAWTMTFAQANGEPLMFGFDTSEQSGTTSGSVNGLQTFIWNYNSNSSSSKDNKRRAYVIASTAAGLFVWAGMQTTNAPTNTNTNTNNLPKAPKQ